MDAEVWGFEFEEAMHFFPIDVSDLEPNRGLQTRYCCGMMVNFDHSSLIPVKLLDLFRNIGIAGSCWDRLLLLLGKFCCHCDCWEVRFVVLENFEEGAIFCAEGGLTVISEREVMVVTSKTDDGDREWDVLLLHESSINNE